MPFLLVVDVLNKIKNTESVNVSKLISAKIEIDYKNWITINIHMDRRVYANILPIFPIDGT